MFTVEFGNESDLVDLINCGKSFYDEGPFKGVTTRKPDWSLFAWACDRAIEDKRLLVVRDGDKIAAFALLSIGYWLFPEGDLNEEIFYVMPEYRKTTVSRALRAGIAQYAKRFNPTLRWGGSTAGFNDKIYENQMVKEGFIPLGRQCVKISTGE